MIAFILSWRMLLPLSYLISCACTKSSLHFSHSLVTLLNEPDIQKLLVQILRPYLVVYIVSKNHAEPETV
jgi:hypothetical protein